MKNLSMYNENKDFEKVVTKFYGEEFKQTEQLYNELL